MSAAPVVATSSKRPVRLLIVDDCPQDAVLMAAAIDQDSYSAVFDQVDSPESFRSRLENEQYDAILCDHNLNTWMAKDALEILRASGREIPFVVVTGTLGDERAVQYLKDGASDYVLKERLDRLPAALGRALREKAQREENARLQRAIWTAKKDWERTFDAIPDSIMQLDRDWRIMRANRATADLLGLTFSQLIGKRCFELVHCTSQPPASCPFQKLMSSNRKEESEFFHSTLHKTLRVIAIPLRNDESECGAIHVMQDVTESRRLEEALAQAQKLEAVGRLAGGIAHDFNNILSVVLGYSELLQFQPSKDEKSEKYLSAIIEAVQQAEKVIAQLLAFSRKQVMQPTLLDLNEVVTGLSEMLHRLIGEDVELKVTPAAQTGSVRADRVQIEQVLMNLVVNARDATPRGGQIAVTTNNINLNAENHAGIHEQVVPGPYATISVQDTGSGMDAETISHVFEPFFTTKEKKKGTGLGLAIVYGIVRQSGGYISVESSPGRGSTFTIYLPQTTEPAETANEPRVAMPISGKNCTETILLVEDEAKLATVVSTVLESAGYTILQAGTGNEALGIAEGYQGTIHLLLSDVVLRGSMDGTELAESLRRLRPQMKILFMSGYSDSLHGRAQNEDRAALLQKPFTTAELQSKVREQLASLESQSVIAERRL